MAFLLIWFPIGMVVAAIFMFFNRAEFPIHTEEDFFDDVVVFIALAVIWPIVVIVYFLHVIFDLIYRR